MYHPSKQSHLTRTSMHKLELPNQTTNQGLCNLLYKGPHAYGIHCHLQLSLLAL